MSQRILMLGLTLLVPVSLGPRAARAQTASLQPGARVRVTSAAFNLRHAHAVVREIHGDTLALAVPYYRIKLSRLIPDTARPEIPLDAIDGIEVSLGRVSNFGRGVARGGLIGAGLGLGLGLALLTDDWVEPGDLPTGMVTMGMLGVFVGGFIGAVSHHDIWQTVNVRPGEAPVTLHVGPAPRGGRTVGLGMTLRF